MEIQWSLVLFSIVGGAGSCLFSATMLQYLLGKDAEPSKFECIVSFVVLVVGGFLSVTHLKHVDRIFEALNRPTSGIFIEAALVGIMCVLIALYFIMLVRDSAPGARKIVGVLGMIVGIVFAYACGASYMMEARANINSILTPLAYCGTALAAGFGLNVLLKAVQKRSDDVVSFAGLMALVAGIIGAVLGLAFAVRAGAFGGEAIAWAGLLALGVVVAIVAGYFAWRKPAAGVGAGAMALCGGALAGIAMRAAMWLAGSPLMNFFLVPLD